MRRRQKTERPRLALQRPRVFQPHQLALARHRGTVAQPQAAGAAPGGVGGDLVKRLPHAVAEALRAPPPPIGARGAGGDGRCGAGAPSFGVDGLLAAEASGGKRVGPGSGSSARPPLLLSSPPRSTPAKVAGMAHPAAVPVHVLAVGLGRGWRERVDGRGLESFQPRHVLRGVRFAVRQAWWSGLGRAAARARAAASRRVRSRRPAPPAPLPRPPRFPPPHSLLTSPRGPPAPPGRPPGWARGGARARRSGRPPPRGQRQRGGMGTPCPEGGRPPNKEGGIGASRVCASRRARLGLHRFPHSRRSYGTLQNAHTKPRTNAETPEPSPDKQPPPTPPSLPPRPVPSRARPVLRARRVVEAGLLARQPKLGGELGGEG